MIFRSDLRDLEKLKTRRTLNGHHQSPYFPTPILSIRTNLKLPRVSFINYALSAPPGGPPVFTMRLFFLILTLASLLHAAPREVLFETFESDGYGEWTVEGDTFGMAPVASSPTFLNGVVTGYANDYYATSAHEGDRGKGSLLSPKFTVREPFLHFLISGGPHQGRTAVQLIIEGEVVLEANGRSDLKMRPVTWPIARFNGQDAQLRILDDHSGRWGIINADHFLFSSSPRPTFPLTTFEGHPAAKGLTGTQALPGLMVPEGSLVKVFADQQSHGVYSPTALTLDAHNRVFIAETHRFRAGVEDNRGAPYWIMDDIASQTVNDRRAMHEKWKERKPLSELTAKDEKIRVLIDEDLDGTADRSVIFADGFNDVLDGTAAGIMALEGTIYFACIPNIYALEDENGDLVSDTQKILQGGFGVRVSFSGHDLNGFAQGPDGRLYATIGDRGFSFTTKEGRTYKYPDQGAILRFEPDGTDFQVVHTGLRNPKEIAFDQYGTAITVDNNSDQGDRARVVFMMEGADSGWRMGHQVLHSFHRNVKLKDRPINRWMQEKMWEPQNAQQPAYMVPPIANLTSGPSGLAYHPGTGYRKLAEGQFLICDYRGGAAASGIWHFGIRPDGAGFGLQNSGKFNWGVAATDLEWGYDGRLYVADYAGGWVSHQAGRVYHLSEPGLAEDQDVLSVKKLIVEDFSEKPAQDLSRLLRHPDQRIRLRAQLALAERPEALPLFVSAANQTLHELERLHGVWGIGVIARRQRNLIALEFLTQLLTDSNDLIRGQAAKALGDCYLEDPLPLIKLLLDPSPRVQALAALALSKHPHPEVEAQLLPLIIENNNHDPWLRHATSLCLAANVKPEKLARYADHPAQPVRLAAVIALRLFKSPLLAHFVIDEDPAVADEAIRAIHDCSIEPARPAVAALLDDFLLQGQSPRELTRMMTRRLLFSAYRVGGEKNVVRLVKAAANPDHHPQERLTALQLLARWPGPQKVDFSTGEFNPLPPREVTQLKAALATCINDLFQTDQAVLGRSLALASQYGLTINGLDTGTLTALVRNEGLDGFTRAEALKRLLRGQPEDPAAILTEAAASSQDLLANTALKMASKLNPAENVAALKGALSSSSASRRQTAWTIIAELPSEHAVPLIREGLQRLEAGKGDPDTMLEILEAAEKRQEPALVSQLSRYQKSLTDSQDPLAPWLPALSGGDARQGQKIFQSHGSAQCMRCHRADKGHADGGEAGPNLLGVAIRHDARGLLEALMLPHAQVAPRYGVAQVTLKDGKTHGGIILHEDPEFIDLQEGEKVYRIRRDSIDGDIMQVSSMPSMAGILNLAETRDLVAWLLTLTKDSGEKHPAYEVEVIDLNAGPVTP